MKYALGINRNTGSGEIGIVTEDDRLRLDVYDGIENYDAYEGLFLDPNNPWAQAEVEIGRPLPHLTPVYS